jgi:adenylate cyclase
MAVKLTGASDESDFGGAAAITAIKAGAYTIPTTAEGEMWIHYTAAVPSRRIPAGAVFDRTADPALIKDAIIFIGTTAAGLRDIRATPMDQNTPGVEVHAMAVEQILLNHHLMRPDYALGVEIVFSAVLGVLVLVLLRRVSPAWTTGVTVAGVAAATAFSWFGFTQSLLLFDPIGPTVVLGLVFVSSMLFRFLQTEDERRWVRTAMAQYLPPSVVEEVARDPSKLKLGGESRELTVMFCDIRGFTSIAEHFRTDPAKLTHLINRVLTPLSQSVLDTKGTIDKYIGDCIMAFWNAPLDDPHHPIHACECALVMQDKLKALNAQLDAEGFYAQNKVRRIAVGIGMNSGPCVVGNMGSDQRFDYSALGDAVNLAARYQNLSGQYGSYIVVGEDTVSRIPDAFAFLEIDFVVVKGRATPARLFALMGPPQARQTPAFQALEAVMQDLFKAIRARDWDAARAAIARGRALDGVDKTIFDTYEQRISTWALQPAPDNWTGAWVAMEK